MLKLRSIAELRAFDGIALMGVGTRLLGFFLYDSFWSLFSQQLPILPKNFLLVHMFRFHFIRQQGFLHHRNMSWRYFSSHDLSMFYTVFIAIIVFLLLSHHCAQTNEIKYSK